MNASHKIIYKSLLAIIGDFYVIDTALILRFYLGDLS